MVGKILGKYRIVEKILDLVTQRTKGPAERYMDP